MSDLHCQQFSIPSLKNVVDNDREEILVCHVHVLYAEARVQGLKVVGSFKSAFCTITGLLPTNIDEIK